MKRPGKFERKAPAAGKKPEVKSVLLQTYFTSLLSLVLCVTLFFGTSYAWFTSEVTSTSNEIYVGTLKVGLAAKGGRDLTSKDNKLFDQNIRWEPGYTTLDTIQISNQGDLAFKYVLSFTDGALTGGTGKTVSDVAGYFDVWVYDHADRGAPSPGSYADISEEKGWRHAGGLDELLAGEEVLSGQMETVRDNTEQTAANKGTTDGVATTDTYTVALHMKEHADASVMGARISLNVKLIAYQMVSEADALGNQDYDDIVPASDRTELAEKLEKGEDVVLLDSITISSPEDSLHVKSGVLDGGGKTLSYTGGKDAGGKTVGVLTAEGGTVQNLTVKAGGNGRAISVTGLKDDLTVAGCSLSGDYAFHGEAAVATNHTMTFTGTYFETRVAYDNLMGHAYFEDCTFAQLLTPGGDTTLEDCRFGWESLDVSGLKSGESITLVNCTYKDVLVEKAVVKNVDGSVTIEGTELLAIRNNTVVKK